MANVRYPLDLHVHSVYSDGLCTLDELCEMAEKAGLAYVALCDHDTVEGLGPMRRALERLSPHTTLIPSIELSSGPGGRVHVLGYGVNPANEELCRELVSAGAERIARAETMLARLGELGVALPPESRAVLNIPTVGRAHIARELIKCGAVRTVAQAFERYLAEGRPAYVPRRQLSSADAVRLLRRAGAVPVLAHPLRLSVAEGLLPALIDELVQAGLCGLEAYHPSATAAQARQWEAFARREGLLVTGGSDYHGDADTRVSLARMPRGWERWQEDAQALLCRLRAA